VTLAAVVIPSTKRARSRSSDDVAGSPALVARVVIDRKHRSKPRDHREASDRNRQPKAERHSESLNGQFRTRNRGPQRHRKRTHQLHCEGGVAECADVHECVRWTGLHQYMRRRGVRVPHRRSRCCWTRGRGGWWGGNDHEDTLSDTLQGLANLGVVTCSARLLLFRHVDNELHERSRFDRFRHIVVEAGLECAAPVLLACVCGERDGANSRSVRA
jgi:hypothetical protein